jgi:hypothetical protein
MRVAAAAASQLSTATSNPWSLLFPDALANRNCKGRLIKAPDFLFFFGCSCASDHRHHHHRAILVDPGKKRKEIMREERHLVKILLLCAISFFGGNLRQGSAGMFMFGFLKGFIAIIRIFFSLILLEPAGLDFCTVVDSGILVRKKNSTKCVMPWIDSVFRAQMFCVSIRSSADAVLDALFLCYFCLFCKA